jgi:voltage-gated potassium channel Kch
MSTAATIVLSLAGLVLIGAALHDVFDALFHESGRGVLSRIVVRSVWRLVRRLAGGPTRRLELAGPVALIAVVLVWAALLVVGWALILLPHFPSGFTLQGGSSGKLVDALYLSLVTLTTVGFGDISPAEGWIRLVAPVEALIGFGLLTASVSWLLSIYPALSRRRSLAYEIHLLGHAQEKIGTKLTELDEGAAEGVYSELTSRLVAVERDMVAFPVAYYFAQSDERFSLPAMLPALLALADEGRADGMPASVRMRATMLREAIGDFATTAASFHGEATGDDANTEKRVAAYARDHMLGDRVGAP